MCTYIYVLNFPIFCAIWLKKCDFLTEKLGIKPDPDPNDLFRIRIWILQKVLDPIGSDSGPGSTTLQYGQNHFLIKILKQKLKPRLPIWTSSPC
jgi:hypothetical protein